MTVTRRAALRQLGLVTGGLILLPGCFRPAPKLTVTLRNLDITGDQQALVDEVADAIIPAGEIPGARALKVHEFVLRMMDDCQPPETQKEYVAGMAGLESRSSEQFSKSFADLSRGQKESLLTAIAKERSGKDEKDKTPADPLGTFVTLTKKYTIQGYLQSEYVMTELLKYNMIPGRFDGCIPVEKNKKAITV